MGNSPSNSNLGKTCCPVSARCCLLCMLINMREGRVSLFSADPRE
uniref:Uncharacterized protein n=1 Tax=Picea glauca TaxID=3330 RepID=A0A117NJD5_PICGL|nr:hypothetical protein ABT39_MTgene1229 [Picea glauca]